MPLRRFGVLVGALSVIWVFVQIGHGLLVR
jgi:hypothetical protein